jgi:hypothetical protein
VKEDDRRTICGLWFGPAAGARQLERVRTALPHLLHHRMTRSDLVVVRGAGQMLPLERRAAFRDAARRFVRRLEVDVAR